MNGLRDTAETSASFAEPSRSLLNPALRRALIGAVVVVLLATAFGLRVRRNMIDFAVFYRAGQRMAAGQTLYQRGDGHYMFKYFPSAAVLYLPLGALPFEAAKAVWFGVSLAALAGMFTIAGGLASPKHARYVLLLSGVILAKYIVRELWLGQTNIVVTLVMLACVRALVDRPGAAAELTAGVFAGIAIGLKPYAAVVLVYLLVTRRWRSAGAALATLFGLLAIPTLFYGIQGNLKLLREWVGTLSESTPTLLTSPDNVSAIAFFTKWLGDSRRAFAPTIAVLGVLAVLTVAVIVRGRNKTRAPVLEGALILTLIPLISPLGWDYTFLMSLLAVILILTHFTAFPTPMRFLLAANFAVVALAVYDVMGRAAYGAFMQWSVTTVNFIVVTLALVYLRFRQVC